MFDTARYVFQIIKTSSVVYNNNVLCSKVKRQAQEIEEMWEHASPQVRTTYSKDYLLSWLPTPSGTWPPSGDVTPVVKAVEHALVSRVPRARYMVDGIGKNLTFIDEYAVIF